MYNDNSLGEEKDILNEIFISTNSPLVDDNEVLAEDTKILNINIEDVNQEATDMANVITERLSNYYFDPEYIEKHPYIPAKIAQEMDNIRRLLKMLTVNEKAQDSLICNITYNPGKGTLYSALTALQSATLNIQKQLNDLIDNIEKIFQAMQAECEKTFQEKDKEEADGSMVVRGSRDFIKELTAKLYGNKTESDSEETEIVDGDLVDVSTGEVITNMSQNNI